MRFAFCGFAGVLCIAMIRLAEEPTYNQDIGPIMIAKCAPCHRPGGPAPFQLQSYQDAEKRAKQIAIAVIDRKMPPNRAQSDVGNFNEHNELTAEEIVMIQRWAGGSKAQGDGNEPAALPPAPDWPSGRPDAILRPLETYTVRSDDTPHWRTFRIPVGDVARKVKGFDIRPTTPSIVRYLELALDGPASGRTSGLGSVPAESIIWTWSHGYRRTMLPASATFDLSSTRTLVAHVLIIPSGRTQEAGFEVGVYFGDGSHEPQTLSVGLNEGFIPPSPAYTATARLAVPFDSRVLAVFPQARDLAAEITLTAVLPNGKFVTLFHYDGYNPLWVGSYRLEEPFGLPADSLLVLNIRYDNSTHSARNRDKPPQRVPLGSGEGQEPCRIGVQLLIP